jgi:ribonuclease D
VRGEAQVHGQPIVGVETAAELRRAVERWAEVPALALDTEFLRERTFFQRLGLIQVSDGRACYLVDPVALSDLSPVAAILASPSIVKVFHSASEDLEVLGRHLGVLPEPFFDTQIAAALSGVGSSLGYQKLVLQLLGVDLPKGETRTDWMARPLSAAQRIYAAEDVALLLPLYEQLTARLAELGRAEWAAADARSLARASSAEPDPSRAYRRVKGHGRLTRRQLGVLQELSTWREQEARQRDLPRGFVVKDDFLLTLAMKRPAEPDELRRLSGADGQTLARYGETLLALVARGAELAEDDLPTLAWRPPSTSEARRLEDRLRGVVQQRALELDLPPEILAPRRILDGILKSALTDPEPRLPKELDGWRAEVVGEQLLEAARASLPSSGL